MKNIKNYLAVILSLILPISGLIFFTGIYDFNLYNWLWCGFYGSILACILLKSKIYKAVTVALNSVILLFCAYGSLMGGIYGCGIFLMYLLIPFYSVFLNIYKSIL